MHDLIGLSHISTVSDSLRRSGDPALVLSYCNAQGTQCASPAAAVACPWLVTLRRGALMAVCAPSNIPEIITLPCVPWCVLGCTP